jgi:D-cysteine desulfhydrase family pyridoxal phosphate-dependent enzyme
MMARTDRSARRIIAFAMDCADPHELAQFYGELLGWQVNEENSAETWVELADPAGGPTLAFQRVDDYEPPTWPDRFRPQMAHLDIMFGTLEEGHDCAVRAGATVLPKPADRLDAQFRVYADPAGHPFCIMTKAGYLPPEPACDGPGAVVADGAKAGAATDADGHRPLTWAPPALQAAPGLDAPPLRRFVPQPTPLEPLDRLTEVLGGPRIWIKRDDCTALPGGGNKARKLEWLVADALEQGADVLLTGGALQSNHARQTAAAAAKVGLGCELFLVHGVPGRSEAYRTAGNLLLDRLLQARTHVLPAGADGAEAMAHRAEELRRQGLRPYEIPPGGSTPVGAKGYVSAANELLDQVHRFGLRLGTIVQATGSGGTQAGLAVGLAERGSSAGLVGISVGASRDEMRMKIDPLVAALRRALPATGAEPHIEIDDRYIGDGYGVPTEAGLQAIRLVAELEGILLDPVYTGKAMAALIDLVQADDLPADRDVVFLHTGGWPALFAYPDELLPLVAPVIDDGATPVGHC